MKLEDLLDRAKTVSNYQSDRLLSIELTGKSGIVNAYRRRNVLPSDAAMLKLCELAQFDPVEGLIWLNTWRTEGDAKETYKSMLQRISKTAASAALLPLVIVGMSPASEASMVNRSGDIPHTLHYGNYYRRRILHRLKWRFGTS